MKPYRSVTRPGDHGSLDNKPYYWHQFRFGGAAFQILKRSGRAHEGLNAHHRIGPSAATSS